MIQAGRPLTSAPSATRPVSPESIPLLTRPGRDISEGRPGAESSTGHIPPHGLPACPQTKASTPLQGDAPGRGDSPSRPPTQAASGHGPISSDLARESRAHRDACYQSIRVTSVERSRIANAVAAHDEHYRSREAH